VAAADLPAFGELGIIAATLLIYIVATGIIMKVLTSASPTWRQIAPGALLAGVVVTALLHFGTWLTRYFAENASSTYGDFAVVLALVTWMGFMAIGSLMSAELNAAIVRLADQPVRVGPAFDLPIRA
jgi:uncharacterized BrkB/YihY/UPF0761 family membrane protein